jgi:copper homeostasis protein
MLRPRRGDFSYAAEDFDAMKRDVAAVRRLGAAGVVFGILTEAGEVDAGRTRTIVELARPLSATFHRAFDLVRDPFAALEVLAGLGVDRVLTSGQEATALQGLPLLRRLVEAAAGRITVMPGGGIDEHNVRRIADATGARELHASARGLRESPARHRNLRLALGAAPPPNEYAVAITDAARVRAIRSALERRPG